MLWKLRNEEIDFIEKTTFHHALLRMNVNWIVSATGKLEGEIARNGFKVLKRMVKTGT